MGVGATETEASSSPPAAIGDDDDGVTSTTIEDLPSDVLALVLRHLDGASLAAVGCASSVLHGLATDLDTWRTLCLAMWPSIRDLPSLGRVDAGGGVVDHRALFADAFPFPCSSASPTSPPPPLPERLVSAVDLRHAGVSILSRVVETDAASDWFLGSPFRVDALVQEGFTSWAASGSPSASAISPADLELSWVLLDPSTGRAINASSRKAVAVDRKWLTGDTVARFAVVLDVAGAAGAGGGLALDAFVTCDERYGHVTEVSLRVEDADGAGVSGRDGLAAVANAMAAPRRRGAATGEHAARERYEEFVRGKRARKEWKARREGILDLCCSGVGAAAFLGFLVMLAFR